MTQLQLIEGLSAACEALLAVVKRLAGKLAQVEALDEADRAAVDAARGPSAGLVAGAAGGGDRGRADVGGVRLL